MASSDISGHFTAALCGRAFRVIHGFGRLKYPTNGFNKSKTFFTHLEVATSAILAVTLWSGGLLYYIFGELRVKLVNW